MWQVEDSGARHLWPYNNKHPGSSHPISRWSAINWAAPKKLGERCHIDKLDDSGVRSFNIQRVMVRPASSESL